MDRRAALRFSAIGGAEERRGQPRQPITFRIGAGLLMNQVDRSSVRENRPAMMCLLVCMATFGVANSFRQ